MLHLSPNIPSSSPPKRIRYPSVGLNSDGGLGTWSFLVSGKSTLTLQGPWTTMKTDGNSELLLGRTLSFSGQHRSIGCPAERTAISLLSVSTSNPTQSSRKLFPLIRPGPPTSLEGSHSFTLTMNGSWPTHPSLFGLHAPLRRPWRGSVRSPGSVPLGY